MGIMILDYKGIYVHESQWQLKRKKGSKNGE